MVLRLPQHLAANTILNWQNLLFGGWWSWLEKWGKLVSIFLGVYYLYVIGRWLITMFFSLRVLYQEHGFGPNLLWGLGPGQDVFPMRFYLRWRQFKQHFSQAEKCDPKRAPPTPAHHEYLALNDMEGPPLPRRNRAVANVYPLLPKSPSVYSNERPAAIYAVHDRRTHVEVPPTSIQPAASAPQSIPRAIPGPPAVTTADNKTTMTPAAADA